MPFSRIGTVIAGRNSEIWFHLAYHKFIKLHLQGLRALASRRWS